MTTYIPSDVSNHILMYYAQIRNMKWVPFIDIKSGKLIWKVNKYSTKYDNINKILKHRKDNVRHDISIDINIMINGEIIGFYNKIGTCICVKIQKKNFVNQYQIIPITHLYMEYNDENNFKYSIFFSIFGRSTLIRFDYNVYQDSNIYSTLIDISKISKTSYSIFLEKY